MKPKPPQSNTGRNWQAVAAWQRNGGPMGGSRKQQRRNERRSVKQALKKGDTE